MFQTFGGRVFVNDDMEVGVVSGDRDTFNHYVRLSIIRALNWLETNVLTDPSKGYYLRKRLNNFKFNRATEKYLRNSFHYWSHALDSPPNSTYSSPECRHYVPQRRPSYSSTPPPISRSSSSVPLPHAPPSHAPPSHAPPPHAPPSHAPPPHAPPSHAPPSDQSQRISSEDLMTLLMNLLVPNIGRSNIVDLVIGLDSNGRLVASSNQRNSGYAPLDMNSFNDR